MDQDDLSFGRFRLDLRRRALSRDGQPVALGSRELDILCVLAAAKGEVVTKDQLMSRVWSGAIVDENNIQVHVSALRKALDDGKGGDVHLLTVPGRGYRLTGITVPRASDGKDLGGTAELTPAEKASLAVLPFKNISFDPEQEYFADGMVEEIVTGLSRIKWLSVVSRNSTFIYKDKPIAIREVADKFGVRYVLEGGVRKSGNRIRLTTQLTDGKTGTHLWAEQYDRVLGDVFALQDEITMCVLGAIERSLRRAEIDRVKRQRPNNINAYDLVLRSLPHVFAPMPKDAAIAIPLLEDAVALQPDYGAAHAFLGWCLHHRFARGGLKEKDRVAAIQHARAGVAQGNDDATALAVAALVIAFDQQDTATAIKLFDRALELSNSNVVALSLSAVVLAWIGSSKLAVERADRAIRLGPFDSYNFRSHQALAITNFTGNRFKDAADAARRVIDYNPSFSPARAILAAALLRAGCGDEAKGATRDFLLCEPGFTIEGFSRAIAFEPTVFEPLAQAWRELGLPER